MAQQTAVEWFADEILEAAIVFLYNEKNEGKFSLAYDELIEQAKEMEKEQMANFANEYADAVIGGCIKRAEQYYNETYGKQ